MSISCATDGTEHPDDATFCMHCGKPLRATVLRLRWEYQDVTIPIGTRMRGALTGGWVARQGTPSSPPLQEAQRVFDQRVLDALGRLGHEGWEAAEPTDWRSACARGRVTFVYDKKFRWWSLSWVTWTTMTEATLRLKRGVPA